MSELSLQDSRFHTLICHVRRLQLAESMPRKRRKLQAFENRVQLPLCHVVWINRRFYTRLENPTAMPTFPTWHGKIITAEQLAGWPTEHSGVPYCARAQESCGDDDRNREQTVFGLAVAGDDAAVYGSESRAVCGVEFVSTGRFWSMDSYEGDLQSPVVLHNPRVE